MHSNFKYFYHCETSTIILVLHNSNNEYNKSFNYMCNPSKKDLF